MKITIYGWSTSYPGRLQVFAQFGLGHGAASPRDLLELTAIAGPLTARVGALGGGVPAPARPSAAGRPRPRAPSAARVSVAYHVVIALVHLPTPIAGEAAIAGSFASPIA